MNSEIHEVSRSMYNSLPENRHNVPNYHPLQRHHGSEHDIQSENLRYQPNTTVKSEDQPSHQEESLSEESDHLKVNNLYHTLGKRSFWFHNQVLPNLSAGLLLFYLAMLSNYTGELPPQAIVGWIKRNRLAQHLVAFLLLLFTINLYIPKKIPFYKVIFYTILLWVWFLLTAKQRWRYSIAIFTLMIASYTSLNVVQNMKYSQRFTKETRRKIKKYLILFQNVSFVIIILLSFIGAGYYFYDEYREYRSKDSSLWEFLWKYFLLSRDTSQESSLQVADTMLNTMDVTKLPKNLANLPQGIANLPQGVTNVPSNITNQVGNTLADTTRNLKNIVTGK